MTQALLGSAFGQEFFGQFGEAARLGRLLRRLGLLAGLGDRLLHQIIEQAHISVHRRIGVLRPRNGDLLDGVLQIGVGGVQVFNQIGSVEKLQRADLTSFEPA